MTAALSAGRSGVVPRRGSRQMRHRGNSLRPSFQWTIPCRAAIQKKKTEATGEFTSDFVSIGLWTPSDVSDAPCQIKKEAQCLRIKYPLHKEVEPGTSFIAETQHTSPMSRLMREAVSEEPSLKFSKN